MLYGANGNGSLPWHDVCGAMCVAWCVWRDAWGACRCCASPTSCLSRCGRASTSATCRSGGPAAEASLGPCTRTRPCTCMHPWPGLAWRHATQLTCRVASRRSSLPCHATPCHTPHAMMLAGQRLHAQHAFIVFSVCMAASYTHASMAPCSSCVKAPLFQRCSTCTAARVPPCVVPPPMHADQLQRAVWHRGAWRLL